MTELVPQQGPGHRALSKQSLWFCGVTVLLVVLHSPVPNSAAVNPPVQELLPLWEAFSLRSTDRWLFLPPSEPKSASLQPPPTHPGSQCCSRSHGALTLSAPPPSRSDSRDAHSFPFPGTGHGSPNSPPCLWAPCQPPGSDLSLVCRCDARGGHRPPCGPSRGDQQVSRLLSLGCQVLLPDAASCL